MTHEGLVELLKDKPELLELLLHVVGVRVPPHDAVVAVSENVGAARPMELRVDGTFRFTRDGAPVLAAIVEVQLAIDERKRVTWPTYATNGAAQFDCETVVVVLTNSRKVATWAKQRISFALGLGSFTPIVLGPEEIAPIETVDEATRSPYLAALAAVLHGNDPDAQRAAALAEIALTGAVQAALEHDVYKQYYYVINAALSDAARKVFDMFSEKFAKKIDDLMAADFMARGKTRGLEEGLAVGKAEGLAVGKAEGLAVGKAEGLAVGKAEGLAVGKAQSVLAVLDARELRLSAEERAMILATADLATLDRWLRLAVTASTAAELFTS